jgi:hypothetical protein
MGCTVLDNENNQGSPGPLTKSDWKAALMSQSACNIVALTSELSRVTKLLIRAGVSSDGINKHAAVRLYVTQISWLSFGAVMPCDLYADAVNEAERMCNESE